MQNVELKGRVNFLKTLQKNEELVTAEDSESDYGVMNFDMPNMDINFLAEFDVEVSFHSFLRHVLLRAVEHESLVTCFTQILLHVHV